MNQRLSRAKISLSAGGGAFALLDDAVPSLAGNFMIRARVQAQAPGCPTTSGISPTAGAVDSQVTISGNNFNGGTAVRFANNAAANFTINSNTQLTVTVPGGAVTGPITISKPNCPDTTTSVFAAASACVYAINPSGQNFAASGGTGSVAVTTAGGCTWTATSNASFVTITAGASGSGNGTVNYAVATNTSTSQRSGTLTIAGQTFTVTQSGGSACTYSLSPTNQSFSASSNIGGVSVFTQSGCTWTAASNDGWISITANASGVGNGVVSYAVAANKTGAARSGTMTIAGQTFTVTQSACTFALSPPGQNFGAGFGTGGFSITAPRDCAWTASTTEAWINLTSTASGAGNGAIAYNVAANNGPARTGAINVANQSFIVTQAGQSCNYALAPISQSFEAAGGNGQVSVTAATGCNWSATSNAAFISITSGASGNGSGAVNYAVAAHSGASARTGTLTIAGQNFSVTQAGVAATARALRIGADSGAPGTTVNVPLELLAQGDENARGFSLGFDPAQLHFVAAAPGTGAAAATLNLNTAQTTNGRLGVALDLPAGQTFATGTRQLLVVTFAAAANGNPATTIVNFIDQPIAREVSDPNANALATNYSAGLVQLTRSVANVSATSFLLPLPTALLGTTVSLRDSLGVERLAPLFFVAPSQVNYQIPPGTALGTATITITAGNGTVSSGQVQIASVAPGLLSANASGQGVAAAVAVRVKADSTQTAEAVARFDSATSSFVPLPLDLGPRTDRVFLILFGTGLRGHGALATVTAKLGDLDVPVLFAGAQGDFVGLDQINLGPLPRSLSGRGEVEINLMVEGKMANVVRISIR